MECYSDNGGVTCWVVTSAKWLVLMVFPVTSVVVLIPGLVRLLVSAISGSASGVEVSLRRTIGGRCSAVRIARSAIAASRVWGRACPTMCPVQWVRGRLAGMLGCSRIGGERCGA